MDGCVGACGCVGVWRRRAVYADNLTLHLAYRLICCAIKGERLGDEGAVWACRRV